MIEWVEVIRGGGGEIHGWTPAGLPAVSNLGPGSGQITRSHCTGRSNTVTAELVSHASEVSFKDAQCHS